MQKVIGIVLILALLLAVFVVIHDFIKQKEIEKKKEKESEYIVVKSIYFTDTFPSRPWQNEKDYDNVKVKFVGDMAQICFVYNKYTVYGIDGTIGHQGGYEHTYLVNTANIIIEY